MNHGRPTTYRDKGCRCEPCTRAATKQLKMYRVATKADKDGNPTEHLRVDVAPVREHVAALVASGWTKTQIAAEVGITLAYLSWTIKKPQRIHRDRAAAILSLEPLTPVAVDDVMVERLLAGAADWTQATFEERLEAGRVALTRDGGFRFCAEVLHLNGPTIKRLRDEVAA